MPFGLSTHLFHNVALERAHFERFLAHGFDRVEIFATRTHFDYGDAKRVSEVRGWIDSLKVDAWSMHAPITTGFVNGAWGRAYSTASPDASVREEAITETLTAADAARALGCRVLVLHIGIPTGQPIPPGDNDPGAARRSLERIAEGCEARGLQLALEVIPNSLSTADAIAHWLEGDLELGNAACCLDLGHAHLTGGVVEAAERLSGYIVTTHVHDNRGRSDDHLLPFDGTIEWSTALMALSKVGYNGPLMFELPDHGDAERTLTRAVGARARIQAILDDLAMPFDFGEGS
jgi:sugar phosphate isomerase/epimerase